MKNIDNLSSIIKKSLELLTYKEKKGFMYLTFLMIIMAILEVVGIASVLPFMSAVLDTTILYENSYYKYMINFFNFNEKEFVVFLGILSFSLIAFNNIAQFLINKKLYNYVWSLNHSLSNRLVAKYLQNDYSFFLNRNSSELSKNILTEVQQVVYGQFFSLVTIISRSIVVFVILFFLLIIDPVASLIIAVVIVGGYLIIYNFLKKVILNEGKKRAEAHERRFKAISEAIGGIKEIKVLGKEKIFLNNFENPSKTFSSATANNYVYQSIPKSIMEIFAFGGILLVITAVFLIMGDAKTIMPIATVYAFAGYRLMPSLQNIFRSLGEMKYNARPLNILYNDLNDLKFNKLEEKNENKILFSKKLSLKNISFAYSKKGKNILENINLDIEYGKSLAIKGATGSGKTTLIDILIGLLKPNSGYIEVDGIKIDETNLKNWQENIAYVPQFIFLLDDSVIANIAFGDENINMERVKWAASQAKLDDVIQNMENGFDTKIGEDGIKLSGGQRQRIGLARAFYRMPRLLILDEATSALDEDTEKKVMENVYKFSSTCTVIMIAHRLSTIEKADEIVEIIK